MAATLFLTACSTVTAPSRYHQVKQGESLESIAKFYQLDAWDLARANRLALSEDLPEGTKLFLPYDISRLRGYQDRLDVPLPSAFRFQWPTEKPSINDYFGWRRGRMHEGLDLKATVGTSVYAAAEGKVIYVGRKWKNYGNMVVIEHPEKWSSIYAHLSSFSVHEGDFVYRGDLIAKSGRTGRVSGPHLHFEIRKGSDPVDPLVFLPQIPK